MRHDRDGLVFQLIVFSIVVISVLLQYHCKSTDSLSITTLPSMQWTNFSTGNATTDYETACISGDIV
uniref:Uncharacterized protein n=1 Tax=Parascaris equorum TaxID=6256 RepID=A0A914S8L7_PAREQ